MGSNPSTGGTKNPNSCVPLVQDSQEIVNKNELSDNMQIVHDDTSSEDLNENQNELTDCLKTIKVEKNKTKEKGKGTLTQKLCKAVRWLDAFLIDIVQIEDKKEKSISKQHFTKKCKNFQTFHILSEICTELLQHETKLCEHTDYYFKEAIFRLIMNAADDDEDISCVIANETKFLEQMKISLRKWVKTTEKDASNEVKSITDDSELIQNVIGIFHNIAMYDDNVETLRRIGLIDAMKPYLDFEDETTRLLCLATLADIVNESESSILQSDGDVISFLIWTVNNAMDEDDRNWDGWSVKELTRIIRQVARNDNNKRTVVQHDAIPLLVTLIEGTDVDEQREALKAIWTLSFDKENRTEMVNNKEWKVVETLEKLGMSSNTELSKLSKKALWTIKDQANITNISQDAEKERSSDTHIMISYSWGHKTVVKQICDYLRNSGLRVWIDVDDMQGSTLQAMASAVEKADIVLLCYSFKYKNSDNCRAEAEYAFQLKKKIVPLKMEKDYKADGWLGFIIGSKLFFDFSGKYPFEKKVDDLVREVKTQQHGVTQTLVAVPNEQEHCLMEPVAQTMIPTSSGMVQNRSTTNCVDFVEKWKPDMVEKWLDNNNLPKKLLGRLRGKDIAFLHILVQESPNTFYQVIRDQLGIKDIQTMTDFRFALGGLNINNGTSSSQQL